MYQDSGAREGNGARPRYVSYIAAALIVYGALGVAVSLRLVDLLAQGLASWFGAPAAWGAPLQIGMFGPLQAHFDSLAWLPWAAWLVGIAILAWSRPRSSPRVEAGTVRAQRPRRLVPAIALLVLLLVGGYLRMSELWPQEYGITRWPYDDEGVYAGAAQLFLQGVMPYRDYFFAHPPLAAISYAPAMAYHFTDWGSPTSFMMARYLSVFYSLVTLALLFLIAQRLAGLWAGIAAGALWAVDGRVIEINRKVMLEGPLVMLSCAAVLFYLWARPSLTGDNGGPSRRATAALLALAGAACALSALTKIAGLACLLAIVVDLVWLRVDLRAQHDSGKTAFGVWPQLGWLALGAVAAALVALGPFLLAAPSQLVREVLFFQFLRPSDGVVDPSARIGDVTSTLGNALTPLAAALGVIVLSVRAWTRRDAGAWRTAVLWMLFSVILFTYSRSFYQHYYIQLAAPLALLGAAVSLAPGLAAHWTIGKRAGVRARLLARAVPVVLLALVGLPLLVVQWTGTTTRDCPHCVDPLFQVVGRYANDAVPPGTAVLSTDEQFNLQAARPPSRNATGYLIDSYGHMIYLGLGLGQRDWGDLFSSAVRGDHGNDPYAVMHLPAPQADFLNRAEGAGLIVVHDRGNARLTPETLRALEQVAMPEINEPRYTIYRAK